MQVDANFGRLGSLLGEKHIGWTNAQDWVEKQALSVHSSSFLCANVSAAKQNKSAAKNSNRSLIFSDPCQEDSEAAREGPSPQNHKKEEVVQDVSTGKESESFPSPLEKSGPSGSYCDKIQETFLHHVEQGTMRPNIADCNYDPEDEWRLKIAQLEHDFSRENNSLRSHIDKDVCIKLDELVNALGLIQQLLVNKEHEKEQFAYELQLKMEDCEGKVSLIQEQLNRLIDDVKPILIKDAKGNICFDLQTVEDVCKSQLEKVEKKLSKNVEILRCEMASSIESSQTQTETRIKAGCDALESSVLQKIVGNGTLNSSSGMDAVAELRNELCLMWDEIRQLSKCRDEIREQVGKLTKVAGETQETLKREHSVILAESEVVKRSLKSLKRESAKSRKERQELRREVQEIVQNFQKAVAEIKEDSMREAENTKRLERSLLNDKVCVENVYERVKNTELVVKDDLEHMKSITDEILREKNNSGILEKELMERMDQLSHYYFSALEEVRADLLAVKMIGQDKLQEMEYRWEDIMRKQHQNAIGRGSSLHDLVMDSLESRLSHLEHVLDSSEDLQRAQFKVDSILAITEKDQECASAAAAKAMVSAEKADEVVSSILESFRSEMESARTKSLELQERLQLESQAMTTACSEIRALCADLIQEKNIAVAASSEAKIRSFEIWEGLQNDMMSLRNTLCLINKDKDLTSAAANEAMAAASQAEALLEGLSKAYEEVAALHTGREEGGTPLLTLKDMDSTQEPEDKNSEMEEMKERMQDMVAAISRVAKSTSQLDEEQRKQGMCILDLSKQIMTVTVEKNGILERVSDVSKKVQNMDCSLANLSEALDKVHTSTQYLEKAAAKHETAENAVLADFERRICYLENPFQRDNTPDITDQPVERQQIGAMEKQHLLSLYKEMSSFFKKLQKLEGQEDDASDADKQVQAALTTLGTRVTHLESKVHQIETGTSLATRTLDSRMDIFSSQLKTAIDAAMTAEGKCSALGSELVKVFRTLASSKKESPSKPTEYEENNDPKKHPKSEVPPGSKYKVPPNTSVYRKVSNKGSSTSTDSSSKECSEIESKAFGSKPDVDYQVKNQDIMDTEGLKASQGKTREDQTKCNTHASTHENSSLCYPASISSGYIGVSSANANDSTIHSYKGSASAARMVIHGTDGAVIKMGRKFSLTAHSQSKKQAGEQSEGSSKNPEGDKVWNVVRREDSGVMVLESKLPITHGKLGKRRIECGKKENIHMSSATGDYQMTDIRLNAGRIFVNVSHRSAFISGTRLLKRGDTLTVKSEA
ncbi:hypothetical protein KP509_36G057700 [Ceratopteris richardii]|nr:hypothetical protein KP509_36G057700 [Ceratopteris richardii]